MLLDEGSEDPCLTVDCSLEAVLAVVGADMMIWFLPSSPVVLTREAAPLRLRRLDAVS